eukprot:TRINITY_DN479_c0_g1_i3.p1 TRINITY_DN479_c0_g1~~TRINITY_DN479_c0_g1_i3.p1  ORF type:complete len:231 (-),score=52.47 TRINITY_DN479_c0_g1_i3:34-726(-)
MKDPNFSKYARYGRLMTQYFAVTHLSQPNYWTQIAGDHFGITDDDDHDLNKTTIVDLLERAGVSWKGYMEGYPGGCKPDHRIGKYYRKHNPFMSFNNIRNNPDRCAKMVPSEELDSDLLNEELPQYMYFTPDIDNDGHDTTIAFAGKYLDKLLKNRLALFPHRTIIVITWDEDDFRHENNIYTVLLGGTIEPGTTDSTKYNHYSLLRTVEDNWDLGTLGRNDVTATPYVF